MNQTFIELPNIASIPKGFFDVFPDLKAIYWNEAPLNSLPNRELVVFLPEDYSHSIANIPEAVAVVAHSSYVDHKLGLNTDLVTLFLWEYSEDPDNLLLLMGGHRNTFKDPIYDRKGNWIICAKRVNNEFRFASPEGMSFADYWKKEEIIESVITKQSEPHIEEIVTAQTIIDMRKAVEEERLNASNVKALDLANKIKEDLNFIFKYGYLNGRSCNLAAGEIYYPLTGDREAIYDRLVRHVPGLKVSRKDDRVTVIIPK